MHEWKVLEEQSQIDTWFVTAKQIQRSHGRREEEKKVVKYDQIRYSVIVKLCGCHSWGGGGLM